MRIDHTGRRDGNHAVPHRLDFAECLLAVPVEKLGGQGSTARSVHVRYDHTRGERQEPDSQQAAVDRRANVGGLGLGVSELGMPAESEVINLSSPPRPPSRTRSILPLICICTPGSCRSALLLDRDHRALATADEVQ